MKAKMVRLEVPLISVCIPVFNGENYIRESINSVLRQTERHFELIVVDNCSTDHTLEIVASYNDPRINVFKNASNIGSISNFNRCIELANGEYFVLLPHDDILMPTMLEIFSKPLIADHEIGLAYSSYYTLNEKGERINFRMVSSEDKIMSSAEAIREFIIHGTPVQSAMVRKKLFSHLGSFDDSFILMCDVDMWCRIVLDGNKAAYFKTPQNCFRVYPEQGQRAFTKPDEHSFETLADHLGHTPTLDFIKNNTYHSLTFKYLQTLFNRIPTSSDLQKLRASSANVWIFRSLVKHLMFSLIRRNWTDVKQDMDLFGKVARWAGVFRTISVLLNMPFELIKWLRRRKLSVSGLPGQHHGRI